MINDNTIEKTARSLLNQFAKNEARTRKIDALLAPEPENVFYSAARRAHTDPSGEKSRLQRVAATPVLDLIVSETAQQMRLEGVSVGSSSEDAKRVFAPWEANGLVSQQFALWQAMLSYGEAYVMVLPALFGSRSSQAWISAYSPRTLVVKYEDPLEDEYPVFAARITGVGENRRMRIYDAQNVYTVNIGDGSEPVRVLDVVSHGMGVCPVVQFSNERDLEGNTRGEVEKFRVVAQRLDKTTYDRVLAQHYNSWKVRYATGLNLDDVSETERERNKQKLSNEDILTGGVGVQFGTLPETNLQGLLQAAEADRDTLAAVSQTPVWALNGGQLVNLSADALAEARSMHRLKVKAKQDFNGVNIARVLRLAAYAEGRGTDAVRYDITPVWADVEAYSLGQVADGLQKLSTMGVPTGVLIDLIPGLSAKRAQEWREQIDVAAELDPHKRLSVALERQLRNGIDP